MREIYQNTLTIDCNIPQKETLIPFAAQKSHPLITPVLAIFFPLATIPATLHYSEFTDKYFPQYGR